MIVEAIYHAREPVQRIYHKREIVFEASVPEDVVFHVIEDGELIVLGAYSANSLPNGLYLDCAPEWIFPVQNGNTLTIEQAYVVAQSGNSLEVE